MDPFQQEQGESSRTEQPQEEKSRQESPPSNMIPRERYELKMMELKLEMMRLEAQKLKHQERLAERDIPFQSLTSNEPPASIYQQDKVNIFHKYIASRAPKLAFKLEDQSNYNNWWNEALTQTHFIEVKAILKNRQKLSLTNLFNNDFEI